MAEDTNGLRNVTSTMGSLPRARRVASAPVAPPPVAIEFYTGLTDDIVIVDASGPGRVLRGATIAASGFGVDRRQRSRQLTWSH